VFHPFPKDSAGKRRGLAACPPRFHLPQQSHNPLWLVSLRWHLQLSSIRPHRNLVRFFENALRSKNQNIRLSDIWTCRALPMVFTT
jgi:hypothetical protein